MAHLSQQQLQRIFSAHELGLVRQIVIPRRGSINLVVVINDEYVLRADYRNHQTDSRFIGEKHAYDVLADAHVPIPRVIVLDTSRRLIDYDYTILTRLPGEPMLDAWPSMTTHQREAAAYSAGEHLARIHNIRLPHFGELTTLGSLRFSDVYDHAFDFYERYAQQAQAVGVFTDAMQQMMIALLTACEPHMAFDMGHLLHSDYQMENLLVDHGTISGVIDFEWSLAGDPTWDFLVEDKWQEQCPGSRPALYAGYTALRPLDAQHTLKLRLYKALHYIETMAGSATNRKWAVERFQRLFSPTNQP